MKISSEATADQPIAQLVHDIFRYEVVKFGAFTLKSGEVSPIYIDFRVCVSYPDFLKNLADAVEHKISSQGLEYKHLCGVPYTALPIATCISTKTGQPMLMRRKEAKSYGTRNIIEGRYAEGDKVIIIEDVVTTGSSIIETVNVLQEAGLKVTDAVVLIDREQGGYEFLRERGITLHTVLPLTKIIDLIEKEAIVGAAMLQEVRDFIKNVRPELTPAAKKPSVRRIPFEERASAACHPVAKRLFEIIAAKKSNLCVAVDVSTSKELLDLADMLGPHVCLIKTHIDGLEDFDYDKVIPRLQELAEKHNFLLFEDRKFADIGATVQLQYTKGVYRVADWANLVTVHALPGPGMIEGLAQAVKPGMERACVLVAEMSSKGALTGDSYKKSCAALVEAHPGFAVGVVSQSRLVHSPSIVQMTPGVKMGGGGDSLGQQYVTPQVAIAEKGADVIIVGRGITGEPEPAAAAATYAQQAWAAYEKSLQQ